VLNSERGHFINSVADFILSGKHFKFGNFFRQSTYPESMSDNKNIGEEKSEEQNSSSQQESEDMRNHVAKEIQSDPSSVANENPQASNLQTENMEVHYHPHLHHKLKPWVEYFIQFIMMFVAVALGFFAESWRESISDRYKEKEYIQSLIEDVKKDTARIDFVTAQLINRDKGIDTFLNVLKQPSTITRSNTLFKLREDLGFPDFVYTDRTIQQLKNSGGLRLIEKIEVSNAIISYDTHARNILILDNILNTIIDGVIVQTNQILNFSEIPGWEKGASFKELEIPTRSIPLLTSDKNILIQYYNSIGDYKRFALGFEKELLNLKSEGVTLIGYLKKEYKVD
jgi:hypothetical protein